MSGIDASSPPHITPVRPRLLTRALTTWLAAATVAMLADGLLYFSLGWEASRFGGRSAAAVLTLVTLPRMLLLLTGGTIADRWGMRRTVLCSDAVLCVLLLALLLALRSTGPSVPLLALLATTLGSVSAFRMPAAGAFPRLLATGPQLARAMALSGTVLTTARLAGTALGGLAVALLALQGVLLAAVLGYLAVLLLVWNVRVPKAPPAHRPSPSQRSLALARRTPGVLPLLLAVGLLAGSVFPVLGLLVPLAARARGWTSGQTGLIEAAWLGGALVVSLIVARVGTWPSARGPFVAGPTLAAMGTGVIAGAANPVMAAAGAVGLGIGTAVFTSHAMPLFVHRTPDGMLARFQALLGLAQAGAILAATNGLGLVASHVGPSTAIAAAAGTCACAGAVVLTTPSLRNAALPNDRSMTGQRPPTQPGETVRL